MSLGKALGSSFFTIGARLRDTLLFATLLFATLLAGCSGDNICPSPDCPGPYCSCDAELVKDLFDDESEPSCGSLSGSSCERATQCMLEESCAAAPCRGNNCNDSCDVVTRCVASR